MKVSVIGTGYVGLVSGVCLAEKGHQIICVDVDQAKVDKINKGIPPIYEAGLEELLQKNLHKNLVASTDLRQAVMDTDLSLIAVGTPFDGSEIDLKYIKQVSEQIGTVLKDKDGYHVVVVKSTVVPGTSDGVVLPILEKASGKKAGTDFGVGMNPEFLKEGEAIPDFMYPDRIVLGGIDDRSIDALAELYAIFDGVDKIRTNTRTAEMIKYTANSLLATLISFSNEIGNLCATVGVDVVEAMNGVHLDKRFTPILETGERIFPASITYLAAGCGFGGSCFPKDVKALISYGNQAGSPMRLLESVIEVNATQPEKMIALLKQHYPVLQGRKIAVLGMAFKPGTDDIRESPALPVTKTLLEEQAIVTSYDPIARHEAEKIFGTTVDFRDDLKEAIAGVDAILIMTRWQQFQAIPELLKDMENPPLVVDGRRMLDKTSVDKYEGIGLKSSVAS
ncbi:UDP-glucose dehydrogenase family protein [Egbenema bharatensis]|uniref:UDP-glucose dehydrogenase family protein n=1 Tax=Egbenema bharatensis TaxID=3463334 RepID=UPI003A842D0E